MQILLTFLENRLYYFKGVEHVLSKTSLDLKEKTSVALCSSVIASAAKALSHCPQTVMLLLYLLHLPCPCLLSEGSALAPAEAAEIISDFIPLRDSYEN